MSALAQLRVAAFFEGVSLLVLVLVAMPLKYLAGMPLATRVVGSVHGLLFLVFVVTLFRVASELSWPLGRSLLALLASVVPFGTFWLDRSLKREQQSSGAI
ncbi:MAG: ydzA1 [Myxococcaceae bacterium]|nr:ydzA1 [Myxococcaceae bacterium]